MSMLTFLSYIINYYFLAPLNKINSVMNNGGDSNKDRQQQQDEIVEMLALFMASICIGSICAILPWVVALRTANKFGITEKEIVKVPVVKKKNKNNKKKEKENEKTKDSEEEDEDEVEFIEKEKYIFKTVVDPDTGKPYTQREILAIGQRNSKRIFLGMLFMVPLTCMVSVFICFFVFYGWESLKFAGSVSFVLNGALSSWVATNKKRR